MSGELIDVLGSFGEAGLIGGGLIVLRKTFPQLADAVGEDLAGGYRALVAANLKLFGHAVAKAKALRSKRLPTRRSSPAVVAFIIEAVALESDDFLRDRWVDMLLNTVDTDCEVEITQNYVSILQDCSRMDAQILDKIYPLHIKEPECPIWTMFLPDRALIDHPFSDSKRGYLSTENVLRSLWNISRLGLVAPAITNSRPGDQALTSLLMTALGRGFVTACNAPQET